MPYTWNPPITNLASLLFALYTGSRASEKIDADIIINPDEILVRQYFPRKEILCSKISKDLFLEARLAGYLRRKVIENDSVGLPIYTLTRSARQLEYMHRIIASLNQDA